jgi:TRAP-type mannitol/chloroaromatic compound transport system permease large subunit
VAKQPATPIADAAKKQAQQPTTPNEPITKTNVMKMNATIVAFNAIDPAKRTVTLRDDKGNEEEFAIGPGMQRFNELKVGQRVAITYYESLVLQVLKPGEQGLATGTEAAAVRGAGALPAGAIATQQRTTVTVQSVDPAVPSVTFTTQDGRTVTRKIADKKILESVKAGDRVDVLYTQALITAVEPNPN